MEVWPVHFLTAILARYMQEAPPLCGSGDLTLKKMLELLESDTVSRAAGRGREHFFGLLDDSIEVKRNAAPPDRPSQRYTPL
ncbi:hypothetical protein MRX96_015251 [Rhipicephalus microplus]